MTWQEYQEAVALLYDQLDDIGSVERNVYIPNKITDQRRQIDVLVTIEAYGHRLSIVIDAKFHKDPIDVKDIEAVLALTEAVGASRSAIVASNGWTEPAQRKADFLQLDLKLLTLEEALDLFVPEKWEMCPHCHEDCIVLDHDGAIDLGGLWLWWLAGQCRNCKSAFAWCQDCGLNLDVPVNSTVECDCGHEWSATSVGMSLRLTDFEDLVKI